VPRSPCAPLAKDAEPACAVQFFAMVSFACPDLLGSLPAFRRVFAEPIVRARDRGASEEERALGAQRSTELASPATWWFCKPLH